MTYNQKMMAISNNSTTVNASQNIIPKESNVYKAHNKLFHVLRIHPSTPFPLSISRFFLPVSRKYWTIPKVSNQKKHILDQMQSSSDFVNFCHYFGMNRCTILELYPAQNPSSACYASMDVSSDHCHVPHSGKFPLPVIKLLDMESISKKPKEKINSLKKSRNFRTVQSIFGDDKKKLASNSSVKNTQENCTDVDATRDNSSTVSNKWGFPDNRTQLFSFLRQPTSKLKKVIHPIIEPGYNNSQDVSPTVTNLLDSPNASTYRRSALFTLDPYYKRANIYLLMIINNMTSEQPLKKLEQDQQQLIPTYHLNNDEFDMVYFTALKLFTDDGSFIFEGDPTVTLNEFYPLKRGICHSLLSISKKKISSKCKHLSGIFRFHLTRRLPFKADPIYSLRYKLNSRTHSINDTASVFNSEVEYASSKTLDLSIEKVQNLGHPKSLLRVFQVPVHEIYFYPRLFVHPQSKSLISDKKYIMQIKVLDNDLAPFSEGLPWIINPWYNDQDSYSIPYLTECNIRLLKSENIHYFIHDQVKISPPLNIPFYRLHLLLILYMISPSKSTRSQAISSTSSDGHFLNQTLKPMKWTAIPLFTNESFILKGETTSKNVFYPISILGPCYLGTCSCLGSDDPQPQKILNKENDVREHDLSKTDSLSQEKQSPLTSQEDKTLQLSNHHSLKDASFPLLTYQFKLLSSFVATNVSINKLLTLNFRIVDQLKVLLVLKEFKSCKREDTGDLVKFLPIILEILLILIGHRNILIQTDAFISLLYVLDLIKGSGFKYLLCYCYTYVDYKFDQTVCSFAQKPIHETLAKCYTKFGTSGSPRQKHSLIIFSGLIFRIYIKSLAMHPNDLKENESYITTTHRIPVKKDNEDQTLYHSLQKMFKTGSLLINQYASSMNLISKPTTILRSRNESSKSYLNCRILKYIICWAHFTGDLFALVDHSIVQKLFISFFSQPFITFLPRLSVAFECKKYNDHSLSIHKIKNTPSCSPLDHGLINTKKVHLNKRYDDKSRNIDDAIIKCTFFYQLSNNPNFHELCLFRPQFSKVVSSPESLINYILSKKRNRRRSIIKQSYISEQQLHSAFKIKRRVLARRASEYIFSPVLPFYSLIDIFLGFFLMNLKQLLVSESIEIYTDVLVKLMSDIELNTSYSLSKKSQLFTLYLPLGNLLIDYENVFAHLPTSSSLKLKICLLLLFKYIEPHVLVNQWKLYGESYCINLLRFIEHVENEFIKPQTISKILSRRSTFLKKWIIPRKMMSKKSFSQTTAGTKQPRQKSMSLRSTINPYTTSSKRKLRWTKLSSFIHNEFLSASDVSESIYPRKDVNIRIMPDQMVYSPEKTDSINVLKYDIPLTDANLEILINGNDTLKSNSLMSTILTHSSNNNLVQSKNAGSSLIATEISREVILIAFETCALIADSLLPLINCHSLFEYLWSCWIFFLTDPAIPNDIVKALLRFLIPKISLFSQNFHKSDDTLSQILLLVSLKCTSSDSQIRKMAMKFIEKVTFDQLVSEGITNPLGENIDDKMIRPERKKHYIQSHNERIERMCVIVVCVMTHTSLKLSNSLDDFNRFKIGFKAAIKDAFHAIKKEDDKITGSNNSPFWPLLQKYQKNLIESLDTYHKILIIQSHHEPESPCKDIMDLYRQLDYYYKLSLLSVDIPVYRIMWLEKLAQLSLVNRLYDEALQATILCSALIYNTLNIIGQYTDQIPSEFFLLQPNLAHELSIQRRDSSILLNFATTQHCDVKLQSQVFSTSNYLESLKTATNMLIEKKQYKLALISQRIILLSHINSQNYAKQNECFTNLQQLCELIRIDEKAGLLLNLAPNYYRVILYGSKLPPDLKEVEMIYKVPSMTHLIDMKDILAEYFTSKFLDNQEDRFEILPNDRDQVNDFDHNKIYMRICSLVPYNNINQKSNNSMSCSKQPIDRSPKVTINHDHTTFFDPLPFFGNYNSVKPGNMIFGNQQFIMEQPVKDSKPIEITLSAPVSGESSQKISDSAVATKSTQILISSTMVNNQKNIHAQDLNLASSTGQLNKESSQKQDGNSKIFYVRQTVYTTEFVFPSVLSRLKVVSKFEREITPIECAINLIDRKTNAIRSLLNSQQHDIRNVQRELQGAILTQVNVGPMHIIATFLADEKQHDYLFEHRRALAQSIIGFKLALKFAITFSKAFVDISSKPQVLLQEQILMAYEDLDQVTQSCSIITN